MTCNSCRRVFNISVLYFSFKREKPEERWHNFNKLKFSGWLTVIFCIFHYVEYVMVNETKILFFWFVLSLNK